MISLQWPYSDFAGILADSKSKNLTEFIISLRKTGKKNDTMRFSCDYRADVITETLVSSNPLSMLCKWYSIYFLYCL